jgi:hypothetical protein
MHILILRGGIPDSPGNLKVVATVVTDPGAR